MAILQGGYVRRVPPQRTKSTAVTVSPRHGYVKSLLKIPDLRVKVSDLLAVRFQGKPNCQAISKERAQRELFVDRST